MPKRIVICADGTWNSPDQMHPTNVVKMARAVAPAAPDGTPQVVFYDQGVGTGNWLDRLTGGAFGHGLDQNIEDGYRFLVNNYGDGDQVFLFGFSRGAYTARSLVGLIRNSGLLRKAHADRFRDAYALYRRKDAHPDSQEAQDFRRAYSREIEIAFVGVWDTVGALGVPVRGVRWLSRGRYEFHDVELSRIVHNAYHALAIDERRGPFVPTLWEAKPKPGQSVEQVWFAGVHSDVGGGFRDAGLSDVAFLWMKAKAKGCGLAFDDAYTEAHVRADEMGTFHDSMTGMYRFTRGVTRRLGRVSPATEAAHARAVARLRNAAAAYRAPNLAAYLADDTHRVAGEDGQ